MTERRQNKRVALATTRKSTLENDRPTPLEQVCMLKDQLAKLQARDTEALQQVEDGQRLRNELATQIASVQAELDAVVNAPVRDGSDPTLWLPDELILAILGFVVFLKNSYCVCTRWRRLCQEPAIVRLIRSVRWFDYERETRTPSIIATHGSVAIPIALNPGAAQVYVGSIADGNIWVASTDNGQWVRTINAHEGAVTALLVDADGIVYAGSLDGSVSVWREDGSHLRTLTGHTDTVGALEMGPNGQLFTGSRDSTVRAWSCVTGDHMYTLDGDVESVLCVACSGDRLYTGSLNNVIRMWSLTNRTIVHSLEGHTGAVCTIAVRNKIVVSGSFDCTVRVWAASTGALLRTLYSHTSSVYCVAINMDGTIFSGSQDHTIRVWGPNSSIGDKKIDVAQGTVWSFALAQDGTLFSTLGYSGEVGVW